jgi:hypothetical protein
VKRAGAPPPPGCTQSVQVKDAAKLPNAPWTTPLEVAVNDVDVVGFDVTLTATWLPLKNINTIAGAFTPVVVLAVTTSPGTTFKEPGSGIGPTPESVPETQAGLDDNEGAA